MARTNWKSKTGFLLAMIGSAVGLGNIWRFPYMAFKNGGGAFLIPYVIALFVIGIPLMILEIGIGHKFRASPPLAFLRISRRWEFLGWWIIAYVFFGVLFYYQVILSWCLNYFVFAFDLGWGTNTGEFFEKTFLGSTDSPYSFGGFRWPVVIGLVIVWIINWFVIYRGVRKGIEAVSKVLIPALFVLMLVLVGWSVTLPGAEKGIAIYLTPDFSKLLDPGIWADAFSQIFFTLSIAMGIVITYASYLPAKTNIKSSAIITCMSDCFFAFLSGFAVFAALGFMSQLHGTPVADLATGGPGLAFVTYPQIINELPFGPHIFGIIFFLVLLFAGLTSSISIFEPIVSSFIDKFGWGRKKVTTILSLIGFAGGLVFTTGSGLKWLDLIDFMITHFGLITAGFLEAIAVAVILKVRNMRLHINEVAEGAAEGKGQVGKWWEFAVAIWVPIILGIILILSLVKEIMSPYEGYGWYFVVPVGVGWMVMTLFIAWFLKSKGWRKPQVKESVGI